MDTHLAEVDVTELRLERRKRRPFVAGVQACVGIVAQSDVYAVFVQSVPAYTYRRAHATTTPPGAAPLETSPTPSDTRTRRLPNRLHRHYGGHMRPHEPPASIPTIPIHPLPERERGRVQRAPQGGGDPVEPIKGVLDTYVCTCVVWGIMAFTSPPCLAYIRSMASMSRERTRRRCSFRHCARPAAVSSASWFVYIC